MKIKAFVAVCCSILFPAAGFGQPAPDHEQEAIAMVSRIYAEVSGVNEQSVDWEKVRSFFADEAVIVLRTSREGTSRFTLDEFIQDFRTFYQSPRVGESGFREEVLQLESQVYHDMAFVAVVYQAKILDTEIPAQQGIDFWLLSRKDDGWKAVAVTNEIVPPDGVLPEIFDKS